MMFGMFQPLKPIVVHRGFSIQPFGECESTRSFFCLDSQEFGEDLAAMVTELRSRSGPAVPVVVVGAPHQECGTIHGEANRISEAGAIYFERPQGSFNLDDVAGKICRELARVHEGFEPPSGAMAPQAGVPEQRDNECEFFMNAPFRWSEESRQELFERLAMNDSNPQKDD